MSYRIIKVGYLNTINDIQNILNKYPNDNIAIEFPNSRNLKSNFIDAVSRLNGSSRLYIRIAGAFDDERIGFYEHLRQIRIEDPIYSLNETKKIIGVLEEIEKGINPNWDKYEKLIYFIGYLKNKIIYHPFHEHAASKDIRSLRGLLSRNTVCAGYAVILKELCDRNGIECDFVNGCCSEEDYKKGRYTTHAWNLVKIDGHVFPVDLTWNASKNNQGKTQDVSDLFNVNEFVKNHFPAPKEKIQDYRSALSSINGSKIILLNAIINKDLKYENNHFTGARKDGSKFELSLIGQSVKENRVVYKYLYQDVNSDRTLGSPIILYSETNVSVIVAIIKRIKKIKDQLLPEAIRNHNTEDIKKYNEAIDSDFTEYLSADNSAISNLLFSKANIRAAIQRGDYFVGKVNNEVKGFKGDKPVMGFKDVTVDLDMGQKVKYGQRYCRRSDGTGFVLEENGKLEFNTANGGKLITYRYRIYEPVRENGQYKYTIKNTIFTDKDIMKDHRQDMVDIFLSRSRLDRKNRETNGYLGHYEGQGQKIYEPALNEYFSKALAKSVTIKSTDIRSYYKEITIPEMKRLLKSIEEIESNNAVRYVYKKTGNPIFDNDVILHYRFAKLWVKAAGSIYNPNDPKGLFGYEEVLNGKDAEKKFKFVSSLIQTSMNATGNVDPVDILIQLRKYGTKYEAYERIIIRMFSSEENIRVINELYRLQNPSSFKLNTHIAYFNSALKAVANSYVEARKQLEARKEMCEVLMDSQGNVEVRKRSNH